MEGGGGGGGSGGDGEAPLAPAAAGSAGSAGSADSHQAPRAGAAGAEFVLSDSQKEAVATVAQQHGMQWSDDEFGTCLHHVAGNFWDAIDYMAMTNGHAQGYQQVQPAADVQNDEL